MTTEYVLGFAFDTRPVKRVLLIEKQKPTWMAGKMNGLGGKIEYLEVPAEAMAREFREECGFDTHPAQWRTFLIMKFPSALVYCFSSHLPLLSGGVKTTTDERIALAVADETISFP